MTLKHHLLAFLVWATICNTLSTTTTYQTPETCVLATFDFNDLKLFFLLVSVRQLLEDPLQHLSIVLTQVLQESLLKSHLLLLQCRSMLLLSF